MNAATETAQHQVEQLRVPLEKILPSPFNPRKDFGRPEEWDPFLESVRSHGVMTPPLVRALKDGVFEIIFGHRRIEALRQLEREDVLVMVREMDDVGVQVAQLIENAMRKGLHPLEEAEAYRRLHEELGKPIPEIAEMVKKTVREVHAVKQLLKLVPRARELFLKPKSPLTKSNAQLVARITGDEKRQLKYLAEITDTAGTGQPMTYEQAEAHLRQNYTLSLKDALFDLNDAELVKEVGACVGCQYNSSTQPDLFTDMPKQTCLNAPCFHRKDDAAWAVKVAERKLLHLQSLSAADAKRVFEDQSAPLPKSGYILADSTCVEDGKRRSYKQLLGKSARGHIVLARVPTTRAEIELLELAGLRNLVRDAGNDFWQERSTSADSKGEGAGAAKGDDNVPSTEAAKRAREKSEREQEKAQREQLIRQTIVGRLVTAVEKSGVTKAYLQALIRDLLDSAIGELTLGRRFAKEEGDAKAVEKWLDRAAEPQLAGLLFELVLENALYERDPGKGLRALCKLYRVDEAEVRTEVKEAAKAAADLIPRPEFRSHAQELGFKVRIEGDGDEALTVKCSECSEETKVSLSPKGDVSAGELIALKTHRAVHAAKAKKKGKG